MHVSHVITETCIGCTACLKVCPVDAITGESKIIHVINPDICIDCGACAFVCPVECIENQYGVVKPRISRRTDWPKPVIDEDFCTGCNFCVDICPFSCLELTGDEFNGVAQFVDPRSCVGCKLCESVCAKGAIVVLPPVESPAGDRAA